MSKIDNLRIRAEVAEQRVEQLEQAIADHGPMEWIPYPENRPTSGETYYVLQRYPDSWDYQIATYKPIGWFSESLACTLRHVTHFYPLLPLPEISDPLGGFDEKS